VAGLEPASPKASASEAGAFARFHHTDMVPSFRLSDAYTTIYMPQLGGSHGYATSRGYGECWAGPTYSTVARLFPVPSSLLTNVKWEFLPLTIPGSTRNHHRGHGGT
jgi:hypothetical protein